MDAPSPLWEMQPGESAVAFAAFCEFRDAGPTRTVVAAYRQKTGKNQAKSASGQWNDWQVRFEWKSRAEAWDSHLDEVGRRKAEDEHLKAIQKYRERAVKVASSTADVAVAFLVKAGQRLQKLDVETIPITSLPNFMRAAASIAQASLNVEAEALGIRELEKTLDGPNDDAAEDH